MAAHSKALVCGRSLVGIAGSNPGEDVNIRLLKTCVSNKHRSVRQADHPCRGVLQNVECLSVIRKTQQ